MSELTKEYLAENVLPKLIVGAKVKIGKNYSKKGRFKAGQVITLIEGWFEYENGLYTEDISAPSIKADDDDDDDDDFDSIYHLFGNDLEYFADCEVLDA